MIQRLPLKFSEKDAFGIVQNRGPVLRSVEEARRLIQRQTVRQGKIGQNPNPWSRLNLETRQPPVQTHPAPHGAIDPIVDRRAVLGAGIPAMAKEIGENAIGGGAVPFGRLQNLDRRRDTGGRYHRFGL